MASVGTISLPTQCLVTSAEPHCKQTHPHPRHSNHRFAGLSSCKRLAPCLDINHKTLSVRPPIFRLEALNLSGVTDNDAENANEQSHGELSLSAHAMAPVMKRGYGAFGGGGATLEKSKLDLSQSTTRVAPQVFDRKIVEAILQECYRTVSDLRAGLRQAVDLVHWSGLLFSGRPVSRHKTIFRKFSCAKRKQSLINSSTVPLDITESSTDSEDDSIGFIGIHHVGILCENLERSLEFYCGLLGLETCNLRPNERLRYRGAWLWVGNQMIHLMELPNPDPVTGRPAHGGEDRHICVSVKNPMLLRSVLENAGIPYTMSKSGRPVIFTRDPDGNALECQPSYMHATPKN